MRWYTWSRTLHKSYVGGNNSSGGERFDENGVVDTDYWQTVLDQLKVHLAKMELSDFFSEIHSKMLLRRLEKLGDEASTIWGAVYDVVDASG